MQATMVLLFLLGAVLSAMVAVEARGVPYNFAKPYKPPQLKRTVSASKRGDEDALSQLQLLLSSAKRQLWSSGQLDSVQLLQPDSSADADDKSQRVIGDRKSRTYFDEEDDGDLSELQLLLPTLKRQLFGSGQLDSVQLLQPDSSADADEKSQREIDTDGLGRLQLLVPAAKKQLFDGQLDSLQLLQPDTRTHAADKSYRDAKDLEVALRELVKKRWPSGDYDDDDDYVAVSSVKKSAGSDGRQQRQDISGQLDTLQLLMKLPNDAGAGGGGAQKRSQDRESHMTD